MRRGVFVTATDTNIGKTVIASSIVLGVMARSIDCGVMKPVQCAGNDAFVLKTVSRAGDPLDVINPFFFKRPLSPHLAAMLEGRRVAVKKILRCYELLLERHEFLVVEGAGGLLVPISEKYLIADLIRDLNLEIVIVARAGLGTINHTMLTIEAARRRGIGIIGVVFNQSVRGPVTACERNNPVIIQKLGKARNLGFVSFLNFRQGNAGTKELRQIARKIDIDSILNSPHMAKDNP